MKTPSKYLKKINYVLQNKQFWKVTSVLILILYLAPLLYLKDSLPLLIFDNLDSNVVWLKILAESGKIFASNETIIPNMMNGLPRLSYGSEFNILLWLYYVFSPSTAYIINEIFIHTTAFISMFLLINKYILSQESTKVPISYLTALLFSILPFWPSAGLSIAILPFVVYIYLNIYNNKASYIEWILLILIPFYTSFVLVYIFFLPFLLLYFSFKMIKEKEINIYLLLAFLLMTITYLFVEYRLILSTLFNNSFISHRSEFNIYFIKDLYNVLINLNNFFLYGHTTHLNSLQMPFILPIILYTSIFQLRKQNLSKVESLISFFIFSISIYLGIWHYCLSTIYTIPFILFLIMIVWRKQKFLNKLNILILLIIITSAFYSFTFYRGFDFIPQYFPIFKSFSLARASFVQPLLWMIALALSIKVIFKTHAYASIFILIFLLLQINHSFKNSTYRLQNDENHRSFNNYFAPDLFKKIQQDIEMKPENFKVVSFGIEPAVSLYNNFYTVDGYSVNYPLPYKKRFKHLNYLDFNSSNNKLRFFEDWGSKAYITSIYSSVKYYKKGLKVKALRFNTQVLCTLNTNYLISSYELIKPEKKNLSFLKQYKGAADSWDIYLYKVNCN